MQADSIPRLSLELRVPQREIRRLANRVEIGFDGTSISVSPETAQEIRAILAPSLNERPFVWTLEPGDSVARRDLHDAFGGQEQSGIVTPRSTGEILIFTNPEAGARYGYDEFEGVHEDGTYSYTGQGQKGNQALKAGNKALNDAAGGVRKVRLFRTSGTVATYVGEFQVGVPPFRPEIIPDVEGNPRTGLIFTLIPVDAAAEILPAYGGELPAVKGAAVYSGTPRTWSPPDYSDVVQPAGEVTGDDRVVSRIEFELQAAFGEWLSANQTQPCRLPLRAGNTIIEPDFYVPDRGWVVEAKRSNARGFVRTAIGQVLDYAHIATKAGLDVKPVLLLPGLPAADLIELCHQLGITLIVREAGGFNVVDE